MTSPSAGPTRDELIDALGRFAAQVLTYEELMRVVDRLFASLADAQRGADALRSAACRVIASYDCDDTTGNENIGDVEWLEAMDALRTASRPSSPSGRTP